MYYHFLNFLLFRKIKNRISPRYTSIYLRNTYYTILDWTNLAFSLFKSPPRVPSQMFFVKAYQYNDYIPVYTALYKNIICYSVSDGSCTRIYNFRRSKPRISGIPNRAVRDGRYTNIGGRFLTDYLVNNLYNNDILLNIMIVNVLYGILKTTY